MPFVDSVIEFARLVRADRAANPVEPGDGAALELLIAPRFQAFLDAVLPEITAAPLRVLPEFRVGGFGRPDIAFAPAGGRPRAFIELKEPGKDIDPRQLRGHDREQFERFCGFPTWALTNYRNITLYQRDEIVDEARILPSAALDPVTSAADAEAAIRQINPDDFVRILRTLAMAQPQRPRNAEEIAEFLGHAAKLVREVVLAQCRAGLNEAAEDVRAEFNQTLFAHAEAGGYDPRDMDALFSSAFAQTLVFGLLLAREASGGQEIGTDAYTSLPNNTYPLLRATLRALTLEEVRSILGPSFDVALDAVNSVDPALLEPRNGRDPVLYLYEDFLRVFDREAVARYGVYYTPPEIVELIVSQLDQSLRNDLHTDGLLDENVRILDPACGTGTFILGGIGRAAQQAALESGQGMVGPVLSALAQRLFGFELLVGPYTVAHYRVLREIQGRGGGANHVPIYLTDTLAPPAHEQEVQSRLAFMGAPIVEERVAADRVKSGEPIIAIMGNPPYKRLRAGEVERLVGTDMNRRWEDLKQPVRNAGMGRSLNAFPDLYVAFYRWAIWRLFEAEGALGRGVLAFITNRNFLTGSGFGGLRKMLREKFEHIKIIDFRGENRGSLPATVGADQNVFNIEVGVCVLVAYSTGPAEEDRLARVEYADVWREGAFSAGDKRTLARTVAAGEAQLSFTDVPGAGLSPLKPPGFVHTDWPGMHEVMTTRSNGIVTYRDEFVYATNRRSLQNRLRAWHDLPLETAREQFGDSAMNSAAQAHQLQFDAERCVTSSYRPLDRRELYLHPQFVDRIRPDLLRSWGDRNFGLMTMQGGIGSGPAVWCHGMLPDQHSFRGSFGGWVFPLFNHNAETRGHYFTPDLMRALALAYGDAPAAQDVFDAVLALLSATTYTTRFAHDLEDDFPHIPFPSDHAIFREAVEIGARIRVLEGFQGPPSPEFRRARLEGASEGRELAIPTPAHAYGEGTIFLQGDHSFRVTGVSQRAWEFSVSGYHVLYRWIRARNGESFAGDNGVALLRGIIDTIARLEELVSLFDRADEVLARALAATLTRKAVGLPPRDLEAVPDAEQPA
jgi:hypothetical protein